ncbi:MAG TPA: DUF2442 domain-containing protein [Caulobacteraceae bacterium]
MAAIEQLERANRRGRATLRKHPRAVSARFVRGKVTIHLSNGAEFAFPPEIAQGLEGATAEALSRIEITPSGLGLHFPALDADLYLPGLLEGVFGSKGWMAAQLGHAGGKARTAAKAAAARENGKLGGRPRKAPVPA